MKRIIVRYILLILGLIQIILEKSSNLLWSDLLLFMLWIITIHLEWFHIEEKNKKLMIQVISILLGIIFMFATHTIPIFVWSLLLYDIITQFDNKVLFFLVGIIFICMFIEGYITALMEEWIMTLILMGLVIIIFYIKDKMIEYLYLQNLEFERTMEQNEYEETNQTMRNHIQMMKELYTIKERNRISRDIHDSVGHVLSTVIIQLGAISTLSKDVQPQIYQMSQELRKFTQEGLQEVRDIVHEMKPEEYGRISYMVKLEEMIHQFQNMSNIMVIVNRNQESWLISPQMEELLYRTIQEFMGNTAKHSNADEIRINFHYLDDSLIVTLKDNGKGTEEFVPHMGLMGIEERVNSIGGKMTYKLSKDEGFMMRIVLNREKVNI